MRIFHYAVVIGIGAVVSLNDVKFAAAQRSPNSSSPTELIPSQTTNQAVPTSSPSLNPNPDSLQLPTTPAEVQLQPTQPITLQQATDLAQRNNRDLQVAELALQRSQAALRQTTAALYPTLNGEAELAYERSTQDRLNDLKYLGQDAAATGVLGGKVEVNYDLFTFGRRPARIQAAEAQVRLDQLEVERLRSQARLDVINFYYDMQQADEQVRIAQSAVTNVQQSLQDAQALEEGGLGTKFDVIRARVRLGNAEQELIDAQTQQEIARRQLVQFLSLSESADVSAADPVQRAGNWTLSLEESIVLAYKNRVELQQQLEQRTIAQQQRRAAIADGQPQIGLFANYQFLNEFNEPFGTLSGYAIGARVRWNFFDGGAARATADQQKANQAIAETRFTQTRNQVRLQVEQSYKNLRASSRSIETATAALAEARQALDIAQFRFQQGVGTQLDVFNAQSDLIRAEGNQLRATLNYNRALATLQRSISGLTVSNSGSSSK